MNIKFSKRRFVRYNPSYIEYIGNNKYSLNNNDEQFYQWVEKKLTPFALINNFRAKEIRKIIYEAINTPIQKNYYASDLVVSDYLEACGYPIQEVSEGKKVFKHRIERINLIGKRQLLNCYLTNQPLFINE